jgi:large subunit GTPase 1
MPVSFIFFHFHSRSPLTAVARGMTRSSFGMPDTSRAARYVLKDYVNAKLLFAHPPPGIDVDEYMSTSRSRTLARIEEAYENGRKRAPVTHVVKNSDTYIAPAPTAERERQYTTQSIRQNAASAPGRSGKAKAAALEEVFFTEAGPAPRPVMSGRQGRDEQEGGLGFSRDTRFPHQRMLGPDGRPMVELAMGAKVTGRQGKKHFKHKEGKKRSGKGYD